MIVYNADVSIDRQAHLIETHCIPRDIGPAETRSRKVNHVDTPHRSTNTLGLSFSNRSNCDSADPSANSTVFWGELYVYLRRIDGFTIVVPSSVSAKLDFGTALCRRGKGFGMDGAFVLQKG